MEFIDIPTEQTTAITDLILSILSLSSALYLLRHRIADPWKANLWASAFGLLALSSALGVIAHGFRLNPAAIRLFWLPLNLSLGLVIALFVTGAIYDRWGLRASQRMLPIMIGIGLTFFAVTQAVSGAFLVFILYEAVAMLVALVIYVRITRNHSLPGAGLMVAGVFITIAAAVFQASHGIELTLLWKFDHNGVFHLVQMVGVLTIVAGLRAALAARPE